MSAGDDLLRSYDLAERRAKELELVTGERDVLRARLNNVSAAYESLSLDVQATADAQHMPPSDNPHDRLAAMRDAPHAALAMVREIETRLAVYRIEGAPMHIVAQLEWVLEKLQQGKGGTA